jgi:uncharacterized protein (TIGR00297 family)
MLFSGVEIQDLTFAFFIIARVALSIVFRKLSKPAACLGGVLAWCLYMGFGPAAILMLAVFFIAATIATQVGSPVKSDMGLAEKDGGRRTTGQVLANAGVAAVLGVAAMLFPTQANTFRVMAAAAFASATSDTLSSELGSVYGTRFYNILTLKKDQRGADGVISLQGCVWGFAGSAIISGIHGLAWGFDLDVLWIFAAGVIGNLADSILGALFERQGNLTNNQVNGLNTIVAALTALLGLWLGSL